MNVENQNAGIIFIRAAEFIKAAKSTRRQAVTTALTLVIAAALLIAIGGFISTDSAYAAETKTGIVSTSSLNVRSGAGTSYPATGYVTLNDRVTILSETWDTGGGKWYYIQYKTSSLGYASADYITVESSAEYTYDKDFESALTKEGFPETYKEYLRKLHASHPNWTFKAANTELSWNDVIAKESVLGKSLVASTSPAAWKSQAEGAYNSETGKYIIYDSGGWVCASTGIIKYYMDPRNFLNEVGIFQFLTHAYDADTQTAAGLQTLLSGTFMDSYLADEPAATYTSVLMEAGAKANVNPYVLASMILVEQGSGGAGKCISGTVSGYEGFYNYFNIGAYSSGLMDAVERGLWYASQTGSYSRPWNTIRKAIEGGAEFYSENYVQNNKNTLYFKKWNVMNGLSQVGSGQYMTNVQGAESEAAALRNGYSAVLDTSMTFLIPVYSDMPAAVCRIPTETDSSVIVTPDNSGTTDNTDKNNQDNQGNQTDQTGKDENAAAEEAVANAAKIEKFSQGLAKTEIIDLKAEASRKKVKLTWKKSMSGYAVDNYQIWRSAKKSSGYSKIFTSTSPKNLYYINTKDVKPNTTYWYKVRGVRVVCGKTLYTPFTKIKVTTKA